MVIGFLAVAAISAVGYLAWLGRATIAFQARLLLDRYIPMALPTNVEQAIVPGEHFTECASCPATRELHEFRCHRDRGLGTVTGIPLIQSPNLSALNAASGIAGAAVKESAAPERRQNERASIIIVEIIGFGGGDGTVPNNDCLGGKPRTGDKCPDKVQPPRSQGASLSTQDANNPVQVIGGGTLTPEQGALLTPEERANFAAN